MIAPATIKAAPAAFVKVNASVCPKVFGIKSANTIVTTGSVDAMTVTEMAEAYFWEYISMI